MSYNTLADTHHTHEEAFASAKVAAKFCNFGLVTSRKWTATYVTVLDGILSVYDSQESCIANPHNHVLQIPLTQKGLRTSPIKIKNYSKDPLKIIEFHSIYLEIDNGIFAAERLLKIGCYNAGDAQRLTHAIHLATSND